MPAGVYNVADDEPLTRAEYAAALASCLDVRPPRPMPRWAARFGGSLMAMLSRSERIANARLKAATGWAPRWSSAREGLPAAVRELATAPAA